jgi:hypothetical protein
MWRNCCAYSPSMEFGSYAERPGTGHGLANLLPALIRLCEEIRTCGNDEAARIRHTD